MKKRGTYLAIALTTECNYKCFYCKRGGESISKEKETISFSDIKKIITNAHEIGITNFRLTGGEPTSVPYFGKLIEYIMKFKDTKVRINTNGFRILEYIDVLTKYKEYIENKYNGRIEEISFRNKEKRGWGLNLKIKLDNGKIIRKFAYIDPYYKAFVNGDIYRECCYNCKYANSNRVGDITLADYWGVANVHPEFYDGKGVSAVIVNNQKGIDTWNKVKDELEYIETSVEFIKKYNPNLVKPTYRKKSRDYIYNKLDEKDFKKFIKENLKFKKKFKDTIRSKFSDEDIERLKGKLKK